MFYLKRNGKAERLSTASYSSFSMKAEGYTHVFQSTSFTVEEFRKGSQGKRSYMQTLAERLNSGERFGNNSDFQAELTFIRIPPSGEGHGKERSLGRRNVDTFFNIKRSLVRINSYDTLCCARAIVTVKARLHKDDGVDEMRQYENLRRPCLTSRGRSPRRTMQYARIGHVSESIKSSLSASCLSISPT